MFNHKKFGGVASMCSLSSRLCNYACISDVSIQKLEERIAGRRQERRRFPVVQNAMSSAAHVHIRIYAYVQSNGDRSLHGDVRTLARRLDPAGPEFEILNPSFQKRNQRPGFPDQSGEV
ncbi:hypothetical protein TWF102_008812 [Orbilia oligospora]|uniref:Uncharacterized protein n=1 Tax=Orbilia oligospora TaxID=2813651 RepID=A0A7C8N8X6_ORBOL|nr:hypothetical protein TWF706_002432 [Orbilia oligospora]KAF3086525.1 hypothetical protein TWF103_001741 [Orbilia oligospora]KAF3091256.1 hypothetical protein TWF102_008812 [Orbilia oligospora]KAF3145342.1 hypothetical protein TWF594_004289 [Orbilia oligospora]